MPVRNRLWEGPKAAGPRCHQLDASPFFDSFVSYFFYTPSCFLLSLFHSSSPWPIARFILPVASAFTSQPVVYPVPLHATLFSISLLSKNPLVDSEVSLLFILYSRLGFTIIIITIRITAKPKETSSLPCPRRQRGNKKRQGTRSPPPIDGEALIHICIRKGKYET